MKNILLLSIVILSIFACKQDHSKLDILATATGVSLAQENDSPFTDYWYQGSAEISTYKLKQARYGEVHDGIANTIFVTEPFSKSKQVKLDNPNASASDKISVLKMNFIRKFFTGVYPYSTMLSVFTPIDLANHPKSLKATFSAQEWCGQTFTQLNLNGNGYQMDEFSYFESEGDKQSKIGAAVLEDELWSMLRIDPSALPIGNFKVIPGFTFTRLSHHSASPVEAQANLKTGAKTNEYELYYPSFERTLSIEFENEFPYRIVSWKESAYSGYGIRRQELTTTATLTSRKMLDYWNKNKLQDADLRQELGLE